MFVSKKKYEKLEKRIADLEVEVQSQHKDYEVKLSVSNCAEQSFLHACEKIKSECLAKKDF